MLKWILYNYEQGRYWGLLASLLGARTLLGLLASLLGARTLLGLLASLLGARTLLGAPGIATRSKDATRGSWHRY